MFCALFLTTSSMFGQNVGISTTGAVPDASAALDISFTNKGLLLPRLALSGTNVAAPVAAPATSLLVYNTATVGGANAVSPGFYYWNGTLWIRLSTGVFVDTDDQQISLSNDTLFLEDGGFVELASDTFNWRIIGNQGTNSSTHFLGTKDSVALTFRIFNIDKMRLEGNGTLSMLNNGSSVFVGEGSGKNDDLSNNHNVFIGFQVGNSNTTGSNNVAVGSNALFSNTVGSGNLAYGDSAVFTNTTSNDLLGIGNSTLINNTNGTKNLACTSSSNFELFRV